LALLTIFNFLQMINIMNRCEWSISDPIYIKYHDNEWGNPIYDDDTIFEFLILEGFQAGLSWITILRKRENFRRAFDNFDYRKIAAYEDIKISQLLNDSGIIRNRLKIEATRTNAKAFIKVQEEFSSFSNYIWGFTGGKPIINQYKSIKEIPPRTELSDKISKDLKKRGFKFVGSTIVYSHMQATGMVNDHLVHCFRHKELSK
jgi:DNA-3-methyladenine glycosylase I